MTASISTIILKQETIPKVELDFMNNTHFEELEMVEKIGEGINTLMLNNTQIDRQDSLNEMLNTWLEHTIEHFEHENELMKKTGFPAYPIHKKEHEIALDRMKKVINTWAKDQDISLIHDYIFSFWPTWFIQHVNTMDMMTAKFAVSTGYTNH